MHRRLLLGCALALAVPATACGRASEPFSTAPSSAQRGLEADVATPAGSESSLPAGQREAVGRDAPGAEGTIGYVNPGVISGRTKDTPLISPIYEEAGPSSDQGRVIGYWALGLGWVTPAEYTDPDFDYEALVAERRALSERTMPDRPSGPPAS